MLLYSFLLTVTLILGSPYWLFRMATSGRYRTGLGSRLGLFPAALRERIAAIRVERRGGGGQRPLIWIHAVSVGEVLAAIRLIEEINTGVFHRERPGTVFAVSTTTEAGQRLACERLPDCAVFYFPLDFKFVVRRYLRLLNPEMLILVESELWPRLIVEASATGIPIAVVNARISDRSFPRYSLLKRLWKPLLAKITVFLAQSEETAIRLRELGAPRIETVGNIKYDATSAKETALVTTLRPRLQGDPRILLCGSTLEGEEAIILSSWPAILKACPTALLMLAPRHPDRFDTVSLLLRERGYTALRATTFLRARTPVRAGSVFLLDTIGDLAGLYRFATVAFVGGSLVPAGGHNPLEPAQAGVPVVIGPSYENFREIVDVMRAGDGIAIVQPADLTASLTKLLVDHDKAHAMGARGRAVSAAQAGATARTADALLALLPTRPNIRVVDGGAGGAVATGSLTGSRTDPSAGVPE